MYDFSKSKIDEKSKFVTNFVENTIRDSSRTINFSLQKVDK